MSLKRTRMSLRRLRLGSKYQEQSASFLSQRAERIRLTLRQLSISELHKNGHAQQVLVFIDDALEQYKVAVRPGIGTARKGPTPQPPGAV